MGKSAPSPPDPVKTAQAQGQANVETARVQGSLNNMNQYTPYGSVEYTQIAPDRWAQYVNLSPAELQAYNTGSQLKNSALQIGLNQVGQVGQTLSTPFSLQGAPQAQYSVNSPSLSYGTREQRRAQVQALKGQRGGIADQRQQIDQQTRKLENRAGRFDDRLGTVDEKLRKAQNKYDRVSERLDGRGDAGRGGMENLERAGENLSQLQAKSGKIGQRGQAVQSQLDALMAQDAQLKGARGQLGDQIQSARAAPTVDQNTGAKSAKQVGKALYRQQEQYLDPQFEQRQRAMEAQLAGQGAVPGTTAYDTAMRNFNDTQQRAYGDARDRAIVGRGQEQSRLFGQDMAVAQFGNQAAGQQFNQGMQQAGLQNAGRQQWIQEQMLQRQLPMNELAAFAQMSGVQLPQFGTPPGANVAPTDVAGIYNNNYQGQLAAYQAQQGGLGSIIGGLGSLGAAFLSDCNYKVTLAHTGYLANGIPTYAYRYLDDAPDVVREGVMAQDVEKVQPEAVVTDGLGRKRVYYNMLPERA